MTARNNVWRTKTIQREDQSMEKSTKEFQEKECLREQIIEMLGKIENADILEYMYKMTADIMKEDKFNE